MSRDRLGKGLGALLGEYLDPEVQASEVKRVQLSAIVPNPLQPRRMFADAELEDLTASIRENGLLQPLVVRPSKGSADRFELVAGERRFRAISKLAWSDVPVVVREATDETLLVLALVENLQREALNPLEEAEGYHALTERFGMKQAEIATAVGKDRSTVANLVRLLKLPVSIRKLVESGALSQGHARSLLTVEDPARAADLARRAASEGWSVREIERRASGAAAQTKPRASRPKDPVVRALEEAIQDHLQTRVEVRQGRGGKGSIEIKFHGADDFERLFEIITGRPISEFAE
ncbi:MAG: ParB/RepB/Spo0J family partition protein [Gemmatimonadetes bacterium]|nr:ParB/RepB/Spo0J family partition protein [Gemmatimonadota bacterium]MDA1102140.1 ParB/RepB/Spo0J family partition protein [Gemmatimonadota bacterium]